MDEKVQTELNQLLPAVKSLGKAVEKSIMTGTVDGIGDMVAKNYRDLHNRVAQLLADDYYVTEVLKLDVIPEASDKQKVAQVNLAIGQLIGYLENLLRGTTKTITGDIEDLKDMGRELQQTILTVTRKALRQALSNIDIDVDIRNAPDAPEPPEPPTPPTPPTPPSTPIV